MGIKFIGAFLSSDIVEFVQVPPQENRNSWQLTIVLSRNVKFCIWTI